VVIGVERINEDGVVQESEAMIAGFVVVVMALDDIGGGGGNGGDERGVKNICWTGAVVGNVGMTGGAGEGTRIGEF